MNETEFYEFVHKKILENPGVIFTPEDEDNWLDEFMATKSQIELLEKRETKLVAIMIDSSKQITQDEREAIMAEIACVQLDLSAMRKMLAMQNPLAK